jgi:WD40 repeat protein
VPREAHVFKRFAFVCASAVALSLVTLLALHEQARQVRQAQLEEALQALQAQQAAGLTLTLAQPAPAVPEGNKPGRTDALGDPLPPGAFARLGTLRLRQVLRDGSGAACVAFSPDGQMLAAAGDFGVSVWDLGSGRELDWLRGKARGTAARFAADGQSLTTAATNGSFQVWETGTGKLLREGKPARDFRLAVAGAFFSPDGRVLGAVSMDGELRLWDVPGGGPVLTRKRPGGRSLWFSAAVSPDGKAVVVSGEGNRAHLIDIATGKEIRVFEGPNKAPDRRPGFGRMEVEAVYGFTFSPDGRLLAATGAKSFCAWEAATGKLRYAAQGHHGHLAFSPDGKYLAVGGAEIRLYEAATGREVRRFEPPGGWVLALAFSPDGRTLAAGEGYTVSLWDVAGGQRRHRFPGHTSPVSSLAFSPDGAALASGGQEDGKALVWDLAARKPVHVLAGHHGSVVSMAWSPDGTALATGDGMAFGMSSAEAHVRLWVRADGRLRRELTAHLNGVRDLAFTPDGKRLATAGGDARVRLWDAATGQRLYQVRGGDLWRWARPSPDGKVLLVGGQGDLALHRADTGEKLRGLVAGGQVRQQVLYAAFLPDGKTVLTREGQPSGLRQPTAVRFWDVDSGRLVRSFPMGGAVGGARAYALAPDGKTLAVAGDDFRDHSIRLRDLVSGTELKRLSGHAGTVLALAFAPDGKTLASGSRDTTVLLWDVSRVRREQLVAQLGRSGGAAARAAAALPADPREAVGRLKDHLRQSAAAEARVNGLLAGLDDDQFEVREKASRELEKLGPEAAPPLRLALEGTRSAESRARLQKALDALKPAGAADPQAVWLALAVLEEVGTPEARQALEELARGPDGATVTREARAAVGRLAKQGPGRKSP